jgi:plastocyanin
MSGRTRRALTWALIAVAVAGALTVAGCAAPRPYTVSVHDLVFDPATMTVPVGTTVTWVNNDLTAHMIQTNDFQAQGKSQVGQFTSEPLNPGESFSHKFDAAGSFDYGDPLQNYMSGTIVVK